MTKYTKTILDKAVKESISIAGVLRVLKLKEAGGTHYHISNKIKEYNIDTSHFKGQGHNKGKDAFNKKSPNEVFTKDCKRRKKSTQLTRALLESGVKYECDMCNISSWNNKKITLHVDHINGDWSNNLKKNLRFLCPNCHSQTETYCRKNQCRKV